MKLRILKIYRCSFLNETAAMRYAMQSIASFGIFAVVLFATNTTWQSNCPPQLLYVATDESSTFLGEFKIGVAAHRVADRDSV